MQYSASPEAWDEEGGDIGAVCGAARCYVNWRAQPVK